MLDPEPPPPPPPPTTLGPPPPPGGEPRRPGQRLPVVLGVVLLNVVIIVGAVAAIADRSRPEDQPFGAVAPQTDVPAPLSLEDVEQARADAGCRLLVNGLPLADRSHLDPADAPPAEQLYPNRPANSGRHFASLVPPPTGVAQEPLDERVVLHNAEHGSVVLWFDPALDREQVEAIRVWRDSRGDDLGFTSSAGGAVFASPAPAISSGKAIALRAWGQALDCDRFDATVADAFLIDHWGSHGIAPEARLSPYPGDSLRYDGETEFSALAR